MKATGRFPEGISEAQEEKILNYLRAGNYVRTALIACGVTHQTFYTWMKHGRAAQAKREKDPGYTFEGNEELYVTFLEKVDKAVCEGEARDVELIARASETQWQAAAWKLERKYPQRWSRQNSHVIATKHRKGDDAPGLTEAAAADIVKRIVGLPEGNGKKK